MKPGRFTYARPASVAEAIDLLAGADGGAKVMAGGQSLGPMMNLRLSQPDMVVDITAIDALKQVRQEDDAIVYGACITHAAVEDGRVPDPTAGFLSQVAGGIAYRAVRNRGTIGGSLAHADPAADWVTTLTAVGAEIIVAGSGGERRLPLAGFMIGPFSVSLGEAEFIVAIRVPRFSDAARFGYFKFCRKRGEFAEAMAAIVVDRERNVRRAVIGATDSAPIVLEDLVEAGSGKADIAEFARATVADLAITDDPARNLMHANALARALRQVAT